MIKRLFIAVALSCGLLAHAQTVRPLVQPHWTFDDASGNACAGCQLFTYNAGTTTPQTTYTDSTGLVFNTNPVILDAAGGANIWVGPNALKLVLKDASSNIIWTVDNIPGGGGGGASVCGPASTIQFANSTVTGLDCDSVITINKVAHTINVGGALPANHFMLTNLGTITAPWTMDITSAITAALSLGGGTAAAGKYIDGGTGNWTTLPAPAGGTVTSVDVHVPAGLMTTSGGPVTTSGVITLGLNPTGTATKEVTAAGPGSTGQYACWTAAGDINGSTSPCAAAGIQKIWVAQTLCTPPTSTDGNCTFTYTFPASFAFADTGYGAFIQGSSTTGSGIYAVITGKATNSVSVTVWCTFGCSSYGTVTFDVFAFHP